MAAGRAISVVGPPGSLLLPAGPPLPQRPEHVVSMAVPATTSRSSRGARGRTVIPRCARAHGHPAVRAGARSSRDTVTERPPTTAHWARGDLGVDPQVEHTPGLGRARQPRDSRRLLGLTCPTSLDPALGTSNPATSTCSSGARPTGRLRLPGRTHVASRHCAHRPGSREQQQRLQQQPDPHLRRGLRAEQRHGHPAMGGLSAASKSAQSGACDPAASSCGPRGQER